MSRRRPGAPTPVRAPLLLASAVLSLAAACGPGPEGASDAPAGPAPATAAQALNTFDPLPGSFTWAMASRFPDTDADGDGVVDERNDPGYVQATAFRVTLDACAASRVVWGPRYTWTVDGQARGSSCGLSLDLPQGPHDVRLRIVDATGLHAEYRQTVAVKDYLVVSMGDSYGSGEGAPDVTRNGGPRARWADTLCHRSWSSASARAARALEDADSHSSVTYVSVACTGATIGRVKEGGSGLLGPYTGPRVSFEWPNGYPATLDPQVDQVRDLVGARPVDVLVLSAGGNDAGFADVLSICAKNGDCTEGGSNDELRDLVNPLMAYLPLHYDALAAALAERGIRPRTTQLMEYPDFARGEDGSFCPRILQDSNILGLDVSSKELKYLDDFVGRRLRERMAAAVQRHRWVLVRGVADDFAGRGVSPVGRGYCARPGVRWINTSNDSEVYQGGSGTTTMGMVHPNWAGHEAMGNRLLASVRDTLPELAQDGTLLESRQTGEVFVVHGGAKFYVPSPEWLARLGYTWDAVRVVPHPALDAFPTASPRDGTLVHDPVSGRVYVVEAGAKLYVSSPQEFEALGYDWGRVRSLADSAVGAIPDAPTRDGALLRDPQSGAIYVTAGGARLWVTSPAQFDALDYDWGRVRNVPPGALAALPTVPRDGTLLQGEGDPRVWLVRGGARWHVPNPEVFAQLGLDWARVRRVPLSSVLALPEDLVGPTAVASVSSAG